MSIHSRKLWDPDWEMDIEYDEDIELGLNFITPEAEEMDEMEIDWDDKPSRQRETY